MFSQQDWKAICGNLKLSGREQQILECVFDDLTELSIAAKLRVSLRTVHTHFERLHRKLNVHHRVQLVIRVVEESRNLSTPRGVG